MNETILIKRAAEVEWMASDARNAKLKPYILEVARTYRRLAKMERRLRPDTDVVQPASDVAYEL